MKTARFAPVHAWTSLNMANRAIGQGQGQG